jgi:hypothetical protein
MYNHYIPQSDGSYRRSNPADHRRPPPPPKPEPKPEPNPEPPRACPPPPCPSQQTGILDFLKGLLPRSIDTADLMIVFLLLLMNKDDEGGLSPVLTLALYFLL